ncbi:MAG: hypothetical protein ACQEXJ_21360 [Myxococcota bacterium]
MSATPLRPECTCTSGTSPPSLVRPRLALVGAGHVGCALLDLLIASDVDLVSVADSTATVATTDGPAITAWKRAGRPLREWAEPPGFRETANVICFAAPTLVERGPADARWIRRRLEEGVRVVTAAKHVLCADPGLARHPLFGFHAALGGAGRSIQRDLRWLRETWRYVAITGNASTTTILTTAEAGGTFADGVDRARRAGVLEPDPELDFRGVDAATKLAAVASILTGRPHDPLQIEAPDIRGLDPEWIRDAAGRGATTRLVGRIARGEPPRLAYERVRRGDVLAAPATSAAYVVDDLVYAGEGFGAGGTARALLDDALIDHVGP